MRGGVRGLLPKPNAFCFSAGLRMRKEHIRLSSTAITWLGLGLRVRVRVRVSSVGRRGRAHAAAEPLDRL